MTVQPITYIRSDGRGVAWIGETNTKVIEVAAEHAAYVAQTFLSAVSQVF